LLRDRAEAEDATQQTFLSAHRALLNGTEPREPAAWLATIARNECWSRISARMREPLAMEQLETASTTNDPLDEAIRRADLAALWSAIEALPRQQRDALLLREFGGLSYGELSAALAVSGAAVESLLFRARQRLRGQLRTAYATVSGASWIDALVRVFAGGSAPIAAKVAVLGAGAAVVGGTAVVVPNVLDNHRPHNAQRTPAFVVQHSKIPPARLLVAHVVTTTAHAQATPKAAPVIHASGEQDTGQDRNTTTQHAQSGDSGTEHATRAETANEHAARSGSGDGGDQATSDQKGDGSGDGSSSSDESSTTTIPELPALPPLPPAPSGDAGGN
jgi:RNA polymerase sigma factor (sigma-70 family)